MHREQFFHDLARRHRPLAFRPEHEPRLDRLHQMLGDLRGKRVFEPGCGAGPLTARLADWTGPDGHVLALDACPGMVAQCRKTLAPHAHVQTLHGRVEDAQLEPAAWNLILCFRLFPHLADPSQFLRQCKTWLAPGGELVIANLEGSAVLNELHAAKPGVHRDRMPSGAELRQELLAAGWQVAEVLDEPDFFFLRAQPG